MTSPYNLTRALLREAATRASRSRVTSCAAASSSSAARFSSAGASTTTTVQQRRPPSSSSSPIFLNNNNTCHFFSTSLVDVEDLPPSIQSPDGIIAATLSSAATIPPIKNDNTNETTTTSSDNNNGEEEPRQKTSQVKISEVLKRKHTLRWVEPVISKEATVREAIALCISRKLNGMMVVDYNTSSQKTITELRQKCVGLMTSRDILRMMAEAIKSGASSDEVLDQKISAQMTPIDQVIYGRPDETIGMCRAIMAKLGIKCLPILSEGRVEGILNTRDFSDFYFDAKDRGGKKHYLRDVSQRVGLTSDTSMAEPPVFVRQNLARRHDPLYLNVGVAEFPHPFKSVDGIGSSRRNFGPQDLATDSDLSEDAHFLSEVELLDETGTNLQKLLYMGVADGVGSWREYGVDPRLFSHNLMEECDNVLKEASSRCGTLGGKTNCSMISPAELLAQSYERTKGANIIGSSTACVALFDSVRHQLHFSNIGDSGIIVLRHIDSDVASPLQRNRSTPRAERKSDMRIAFVSQQQLKSFNHPFQMGWTGEEIVEKNSSFKMASDSCASSVHILRGDIIIMATDGLFDNVDVEDLAYIALQWEHESGFIENIGGIPKRNKRWDEGESRTDISAQAIPRLAEILCQKARENSLDNTVDSPFAMLAKENDIMW
eukprot:CAMPEP_0201661086 /NCGR_PEP_ID=MMETSP0494-20130426/3541_1 /ASSEMBLY_ACC=CAM_ASM_000839 /TAXON_ID=420259 /ORGANISM="Thalassiosira gravida, Strain GMp14c1" /LENGTH=660 /DNA_ID=CAMNT_0048139109 /DNA_START=287 /DNA_END=2266 /DNA_ORIENTATION=+